jgi:cell fate (sporulation/competence/biofilm development) regulator YmcA (YheA/YmcA/DUF963 family)
MELQILFNIVVGVAAFFGGWSLNQITRSIDRLDKDVRNMPLTYVTQSHYQRDIDDIKNMLGKIFDRLDEKVDKK